MEEYIKLQNANITQHSSGGDKTSWKIYANSTGELLGELPRHLTESEVFSIINLARQYEHQAFNIGIKLGKEKTAKVYEDKISDYVEVIKQIREENERLSEALHNEMQITINGVPE